MTSLIIFLISFKSLPPMLNLHLEHLHFDKRTIKIDITNTNIFQNTKKSSIIAMASEMSAIAANFEDIVNVKYALIPVANVTANNKEPKNSKFSIFLKF